MRVYHIVNEGDMAEASGVGTFIRRVNDALNARGVESCIISDSKEFDTAVGNLNLGLQPVVFHIHGMWLMVQHRAAAWAKRHGVPVVWSTHGMTAPWCMHHKWWKKCLPWHLYQKRDLQGAVFIHCTTELEADWNHALGFANTVIVPLGTALPKSTNQPINQSNNSNPDLHLPPTPKTLLYVGRIYPVKAIDRLIQAFQMVPHEGWRLRIVGPDEAGHLAELKGIAGADVDFAGPKYGNDLAAEYEACDALALVSHTENFGATVIDAMAHGKPVITSTNTPWKIVADRRCGWWCSNKPEELAKSILQLFNSSALQLRTLGANGRALVEERFTWSAVCEELERIYEKAI